MIEELPNWSSTVGVPLFLVVIRRIAALYAEAIYLFKASSSLRKLIPKTSICEQETFLWLEREKNNPSEVRRERKI